MFFFFSLAFAGEPIGDWVLWFQYKWKSSANWVRTRYSLWIACCVKVSCLQEKHASSYFMLILHHLFLGVKLCLCIFVVLPHLVINLYPQPCPYRKLQKSVAELETLYQNKTGAKFMSPSSGLRRREKVSTLSLNRCICNTFLHFLFLISNVYIYIYTHLGSRERNFCWRIRGEKTL